MKKKNNMFTKREIAELGPPKRRKEKTVANKDKLAKVKKNINIKQKTDGILQLFVVASAIYAVAIIAMGTEGYTSIALVSPLALWSALTLIKQFAK